MKLRSKTKGFTLIEMLIAIIILSILYAMAVPSFRTMVERNRVYTVTNEFTTALFYIRSMAIKRQMNVIMCVRNTSASNCESNSSNYDYANGWIIYIDCDNDGVFDQTALTCDLDGNGVKETSELLRIHEKIDHVTALGNGNYDDHIGYKMNGRINGIGGSIEVDLIDIEINNQFAKKIIVANTGRIRTIDVN